MTTPRPLAALMSTLACATIATACGTRTVQPLTLGELRPAGRHIESLSAPRPEQVLREAWVPVWGRPSPSEGRVVVGSMGTPNPTFELDLREGRTTWKKNLSLDPIEDGPPDWYRLAGSNLGQRATAIYVLDRGTGETTGTIPIVEPMWVAYRPGAPHALVVDSVSASGVRLRSIDRLNGRSLFTKRGAAPKHLIATKAYAVRVAAESITRDTLADGESRDLSGTFGDVVELVGLGDTHAVIVRPSRVEVIDLTTMHSVQSKETGEIATVGAGTAPIPAPRPPSASERPRRPVKGTPAPSSPASGPAFAVVTRAHKLLMFGEGNLRFEADVPFAGRPFFAKMGIFVYDGRKAVLVGWDGATIWSYTLPPWVLRSELSPTVLEREGAIVIANEHGVTGLDVATGEPRFVFDVRGASPSVLSLTREEKLGGGIDEKAAAARKARLGELLLATRGLGGIGSGGGTVTGFAMGASAYSSTSLLQAQAMAIVASDAKRANYAASEAVEMYIAAMGARELIQGEYYVRRLHWFWGQGVLVVRLRDGAWREALTGPACKWGKTWHCHAGLGIVAAERLLTLGMRIPPSAYVDRDIEHASPPTPCPLTNVQVWDLSTNMRGATEYPRASLVGEHE